MTVADVHEQFRLYKKEIADVDTSEFYRWCDTINRTAYRYLYRQESSQYVQSQSYSVLPNVTSYALPTNFLTMDTANCGLFLISSGGIQTNYQIFQTGFGAATPGYYLEGGSIVITPIPQIGFQFTLRYIPIVPEMDSDPSILVIPDEFMNYVLKAIDIQYDMWDEDPNAEVTADQRFINVLEELCQNMRKESGAFGVNTYAYMFR